MTRHLAAYYRYLSKEADIVYLKDEVAFAGYYLGIQSLRKDFQFDIQMDPSLDKVPILPLLIQPIIENAIEHGIEEKDGASFISLIVEKSTAGHVCISVSDDGPGMTEEERVHLYDLINRSARQTESIGLWNVNQRLKNVYGKEAGLTFSTNEFGGLTVCFEIDKKGGVLRHEMLDY